MKTLTTRTMIAVAALAAAAASASAQTYKADIPMNFKVSGKAMGAGSYVVQVVKGDTSYPVLLVRNVATGNSALLASMPGSDAPKEWVAQAHPVISFECLNGNCVVRKFWNSTAPYTYQFPGLKVRPADAERIAYVAIPLSKAD